jgi:hypothetical protein
VWDEVKKEKSWDAEGRPVAADERFVYSVERDVLVRRALEGEGKAERATLPGVDTMLALRGHRMLGLIAAKDGWTVAAFDFKAGTRTTFDLARPGRGKPTFPRSLEPNMPLFVRGASDETYRAGRPLGWDATKGELYASDGAAIYRVPAGKAAAWKPTWEAVP